MRQLAALATLALIVLCAACGAGGKTSSSAEAKQPTDPRGVPTATLPAILPSAMPATTVTDGGISGQLNVLPTSYTVKSGDTMAAIAAKLGLPLTLLTSYNPDVNPNSLIVGQVVRVPPPPTASSTSTPGSGASSRPGTPVAGGSGGSRPATAPAGAGTSVRAAAAATTPAGSSAAAAGPGGTYTVKSGDTACAIAAGLHVTLADLASANGLTVSQMASVKVGQVLKVPATTSASPGC